MQLGFTFQPALWELLRFTQDEDLRSILPQTHQPQEQGKNTRKSDNCKSYHNSLLQHQLQDARRISLKNSDPRKGYEIKTNKDHI